MKKGGVKKKPVAVICIVIYLQRKEGKEKRPGKEFFDRTFVSFHLSLEAFPPQLS